MENKGRNKNEQQQKKQWTDTISQIINMRFFFNQISFKKKGLKVINMQDLKISLM